MTQPPASPPALLHCYLSRPWARGLHCLWYLPCLLCLFCLFRLASPLAPTAHAAEAVWPIPALTAEQPGEKDRQKNGESTRGQKQGQEQTRKQGQKQSQKQEQEQPQKQTGEQAKEQKKEQAQKQEKTQDTGTPQPPRTEDAPQQDGEAAPGPLSPRQEAAAAYARGEYSKAYDLWRVQAAKGDAGAMNGLGLLHERGQGVEPDAGRALHWFARAAEAGDIAGMSNYGRMLEQGRGTMPDPAAAARWFDLAARQGSPEAQYNLGLLYEHGRGVPQDDKAAAAWYSRAAAAGEGAALSRLGQFYRHGRGVPQDMARATLLLHAAAMQGQEDAIRELEELAQRGPERPPAVLFGQRLDDTDRTSMRAALHKAKVPAKRASDDFVCDVYDVRTAVPGATEMALCYAAGKAAPLGFVKLDYPAQDEATAQRILQMAEARFGPPSAGEGNDARLWNLGSAVVATQYLPEHKLMSLMYMIPRVYHQTQRP